MANALRKSVLSDFVARHSGFDFDDFFASNPGEDEFDRWCDYCLPHEYSDACSEYEAIRNHCGLFDVSPMKKYRFKGKEAGAFLDGILTAPVSQHKNMKAAYGLLSNEDGFLLDDGIVMKLDADEYILITTEIDLMVHFANYNHFTNLAISDETDLFVGIAVQGPASCRILTALGFEGVENLAPFALQYFELCGHQFLVGRLGFTGDLGYEVWFGPEAANTWISAFERAERELGLEVPPYGLTAVQACRIEAGMIVPGWDTAGEFTDLQHERTPFELTLGWNVKLDRPESFAGKSALIKHKEYGPRFHMTAFTIEGGCKNLEFGEPLYATVDGNRVNVGALPSLVLHPTSNEWIGFASIKVKYKDTPSLYILDQGREIACHIRELPFINLERRNKTPAKL